MIKVHKARTRGQADYGWLKANYSFSFANYFDPRRMGFRTLRVLNEDYIAGGGGFPSHGHSDMEILTYIIEGSLEHIDSMGNRGVIEAGEFQMMSAGKGVLHSEANASQTESVHLFQIWIEPDRSGLRPGYKQMRFDGIHNELRLVAGPAGRKNTAGPDHLSIHQDTSIFSAQIDADCELTHTIETGRGIWLQVASGAVQVGGKLAQAGDGVEIEGDSSVILHAISDCKLLLFDLA